MKAAIAIACALLLAPCAGAAQSDSSDDTSFLDAARAYGDGDYATAAELFGRAYEATHDPALLVSRGRAAERAGMTREAVEAYERYLEEAPDAEDRPDVERSLGTLRRQLELEERVAERDTEPDVVVAPIEPTSSGAPSGPAPWIVAGIGAAGLVVATVLGVVAMSRYADAEDEPTALAAVRLQREASDFGLGANVMFGVGGGLLAIGVVWGVIELATSGSAPSDEEDAP
ncbi:MAG: hypothetical protein AB7S26_23935 [Sandaracinaceae bacterium]